MGLAGDIGVAFSVVIIAGLMTPFGATLAFFVDKKTIKAVPLSLAFAAGILIWVAMAGVHPEAIHMFSKGLSRQYAKDKDHDHHNDVAVYNTTTTMLPGAQRVEDLLAFERVDDDDDEHHDEDEHEDEDEHDEHEEHDEVPGAWKWAPRCYTLLSMFLGILFAWTFDYAMHLMGYGHDHGHSHEPTDENNTAKTAAVADSATLEFSTLPMPVKVEIPAVSPMSDLNSNDTTNDTNEDDEDCAQPVHKETGCECEEVGLASRKRPQAILEIDVGSGDDIRTRTSHLSLIEKKQLHSTSLSTALAVSLHNFPEGLATFVSTVAEPKLGILVGVAVALHNLPLGVSVGMPVYFATDSKWQAIGWAAVCGLTALIGAFVGLAIVLWSGGLNPYMSGVMFSMVVGIMLWTAFKELIPQARAFDPKDHYCTFLIFAGFVVMEIALLIFDSTGGHTH